ncbi:MAG TPA: acyl-CoA desaturase [Acidimicrobiales bacterium]|nr:acyl-CoA desaturase [Acidimicrobiales bacterium]
MNPESPSPATPVPAPSTSLGPRIITAALVVGPLAAVSAIVPSLWGRAVHLRDLVLALVLYAVTGHGVTVGFHRMFTHGSFRPNRPLKIALAVAGSMAVEGSLVAWVANHRRHHMFSDRQGDPHSPHLHGSGLGGQLRGLAHAHVGWLFRADPTPAERYAPDLLRDRDVTVISALFPLLAVVSLALPFFIGWGLSGSPVGGVTTLVWAGLVRMAVLHHVTWSVNSICHMFGRKPFTAKDQSRNFAPLAVLSMGESWHNLHHAYPSSARHGVGRGQIDSSAALIRLFEHAGWASKVRWPATARLSACAAGSAPVPEETETRREAALVA